MMNPTNPWNSSNTRVVILRPSFSIFSMVFWTSAKMAWNTASTECSKDSPIAAKDIPKFVNAAIIVDIGCWSTMFVHRPFIMIYQGVALNRHQTSLEPSEPQPWSNNSLSSYVNAKKDDKASHHMYRYRLGKVGNIQIGYYTVPSQNPYRLYINILNPSSPQARPQCYSPT